MEWRTYAAGYFWNWESFHYHICYTTFQSLRIDPQIAKANQQKKEKESFREK
jgi:hypothetical protein